jgi:hypothetical protein
MIITDKFVYIHPPKTGGSFVTSALLEAHAIKWSRLHHLKLSLTGRLTFQSRFGPLTLCDKHGACRRIPAEHRDKPILSTIRHPFDYYISDYEFGWWKRREWRSHYRSIPAFEQQFPAFPHLSFPDYLRLMSAAFAPMGHRSFENPDHTGFFTAAFIRMFFREPVETPARFSPEYAAGDAYKTDMYPVTFLTTKELNRRLYEYLLSRGYPEGDIGFILQKGKVLPLGKGREGGHKWQNYYTPELQELLRKKDRFLFRLFPAFDLPFPT